MTSAVKFTCDNCGKDVTTGPRHPDYRVVLVWEYKIPQEPEDTNAPILPMPFDGTKHFCDLKCAQEWIGKKITSG